MTQEEKNLLIPREGYANAYIEMWTDLNGEKHEDFSLGKFYKNKEDVPNPYGKTHASAIHLGVVKLEIKQL